jgi:hypothetical protein
MQLPRPAFCVLACLVLGSVLTAQSTHTISPRGLALVPGGNTTGYPWGYSGSQAFRYQQIHDDMAGSPHVILGMAVRRKEVGTAWPALSPTLQVDLSTAATGSQTATSNFASNHGMDRTVVMVARQVNFPAVNAPTNGLPAPFTYVMMFDQPFIFLGQGSLCWEVLMSANNYAGGTTLNLDLAQNGLARNQVYGQGCRGALSGTYAAPNLDQTATGLAANSVAILMVGYNNQQFAGVPLPLDLTPAGAPGCSLYLAPILFLVAPTNASGTATFSLDTTGAPTDVAVQLQVLAPDTGNALGLVLTNALFATPLMTRTFMRNWNANVASATGSLQIVYALVTDFLEP